MKTLMRILLIVVAINFNPSFADSPAPKPRVYDGINTTPADYPDFVYILGENSSCGGTLISKNWVLTKV